VRRFDGGLRRFLIRIGPVLDEQIKSFRWFGTGHDIEESEKAPRISFVSLSTQLPRSSTARGPMAMSIS